VLTVITLGWYGAIVIMDAGVSASEAAHLAGAVLCGGLIAAGLLPQLVAPARNVAGFQQTLMVAVAVMVAAAIEGNPNNQAARPAP
jgi:cyanate permease